MVLLPILFSCSVWNFGNFYKILLTFLKFPDTIKWISNAPMRFYCRVLHGLHLFERLNYTLSWESPARMKEHITPEQLRAAQNRNESALAAVIARYIPLIRRVARRAVSPGLEFEDAIQEGLIGLFHAIQTYSPAKGNFTAYAQVCVQNAVFTAQRTAGRKKHAPLNHSVPIPDEESIPGPEDEAIVHEQVSLTLQKARTRLSPLEKTVLHMFLDGFSYQEIAAKLGCPPKTVDNALARVRRKLK